METWEKREWKHGRMGNGNMGEKGMETWENGDWKHGRMGNGDMGEWGISMEIWKIFVSESGMAEGESRY